MFVHHTKVELLRENSPFFLVYDFAKIIDDCVNTSVLFSFIILFVRICARLVCYVPSHIPLGELCVFVFLFGN